MAAVKRPPPHHRNLHYDDVRGDVLRPPYCALGYLGSLGFWRVRQRTELDDGHYKDSYYIDSNAQVGSSSSTGICISSLLTISYRNKKGKS